MVFSNSYDEEKIVFKVNNVRRGSFSLSPNTLVVTNKGLIFEERGLIGNLKGSTSFDYSIIEKVEDSSSSDSLKHIEVYLDTHIEKYTFQTSDDDEIKILLLAINDQLTGEGSHLTLRNYKELLDKVRKNTEDYKLKVQSLTDTPLISKNEPEYAEEIIKNVIASGKFDKKSFKKAAKKVKKQNSFMGLMKEELLTDLGFRDLQDEFTEFKNDIRDEFGLERKQTYADKRRLSEQELNDKKLKLLEEKEINYHKIINERFGNIANSPTRQSSSNNISVNANMSHREQMELLREFKELLDSGILTDEEFNLKKKEILNNW